MNENIEVGKMIVVKQEKSARLGKVLDEEVKLQWYGANTLRVLPRKRWSWLPTWETAEGKAANNMRK